MGEKRRKRRGEEKRGQKRREMLGLIRLHVE